MRFKNVEHYEPYINNIDMDYNADNTIFTAYIYNLNTPELDKVNRSEYGKATNFKQDTVEVIDDNC